MRTKIICSFCGNVRRFDSNDGDPGCPCPKPTATETAHKDTAAYDRGVEAIELAKELFEVIEELPEQAEDFGMSISEKARDILNNIEAKGTATEKQVQAIKNMLGGARKWLR